MSMRSEEVEAKLKDAVEKTTPDVFEKILERCDGHQGVVYAVPQNMAEQARPRKRKRRIAHVAASLAAALVLALGGVFAYNTLSNNSVDMLVMLDVNPSIEIKLNKNARVIEANARNQEGIQILDNMDLKGTHIDVAVNALVGSMLKYGYIKESTNSILLSVEGMDTDKTATLQKNLMDSIGLQITSANGAVISQNLTADAALQKLADDHNVSYGKAALVQKIIDQNSHLAFADLAKLSINELNLLFASKHIEAAGVEQQGSASDANYIGEEKALQKVLAHAGIEQTNIQYLTMELDFEDGLIVYDIEFTYNFVEYEYEVNAVDGNIIGSSQEKADSTTAQDGTGSQSAQASERFISEAKAIEIVEAHSGIRTYEHLTIELDKDDGTYIYEVEFHVGDKEYDYEVDAVTGAVISAEIGD